MFGSLLRGGGGVRGVRLRKWVNIWTQNPRKPYELCVARHFEFFWLARFWTLVRGRRSCQGGGSDRNKWVDIPTQHLRKPLRWPDLLHLIFFSEIFTIFEIPLGVRERGWERSDQNSCVDSNSASSKTLKASSCTIFWFFLVFSPFLRLW